MKNVLKLFVLLLVTLCFVGCKKEEEKLYLNELVKKDDITNIVIKGNSKEVTIKDEELSYVTNTIDPLLFSELKKAQELSVSSFFDSRLKNGLSFSLYYDNKYYCKIGQSFYELIVNDSNIKNDIDNLSYYLLDSINEKILFDYNILYSQSNLTCKIIGSYDNLLVCAINDNKSMDVTINNVKFSSIDSYSLYSYDVINRIISPLSNSNYSSSKLETIKNDFYLEILSDHTTYSNFYGAYNEGENLVLVYSINSSTEANTTLGNIEFNMPLYGYSNNKSSKLEDLYNNGLFSDSDRNKLYDKVNNNIDTLASFTDILNINKNSIKEIVIYSYRLDNTNYNVYYYTNELNDILSLYSDFISKPLVEKELGETGFTKSVKIVTDSMTYTYPLSIIEDGSSQVKEFELDREENVFGMMFESSKVTVNSSNQAKEIEIGNILFESYTPDVYDLTSSLTFEASLFGEEEEFVIIDSRHFRWGYSYYEVIGSSDFSSVIELKSNDKVILTIQDKTTKICDIIYDKNERVNVSDVIEYLKQFGYKYSYRSFYYDIDLKDEATIFTLSENDTIYIGPITLPWI